MVLLFVLALLFLPSNEGHLVNSHRPHNSDSLRAKCEALPYRSAYVGNRCYFAVSQEVKLNEATARCSAIFRGAQLAIEAPTQIFIAMMLEKSKFHAGKDSSGEKQAMCSIDSGYQCGENIEQSPIIPGKCIARHDNILENVEQATLYCSGLGMKIPTIDSELENRMIIDAIPGKGYAWIRDKLSNGRWTREKYYLKYDNCNRPNVMYAGGEIRSLCPHDGASVLDKKSGYWGVSTRAANWNMGTSATFGTVCVADALNELTPGFTPVDSSCDYHEENVQAFPAISGSACLNVHSKTCYSSTLTTTKYAILGKATVETRRGCEVLCDTKSNCVGFSFKDGGLSSSCIMLSSPSKRNCDDPTTIFLKQTSGCAARTNITAEFGVDPCIDEMVPSAFLGGNPICQSDKDKQYITRAHPAHISAIDACGRRITWDNDNWNSIHKAGHMWQITYGYEDGYKSTPIPIVAAACVIARGAKCPCAPIQQINNVPGKHSVPATTDRWNPCPANYPALRGDVVRYPGQFNQFKPETTAEILITCKAGMWMNVVGNTNFGITSLGCYY